ncbi:MAG: hypothetical protein ACYDCO_12885 [Armatimonadota bacterium]
MAAITAIAKRRPRKVNERELVRSGFTCTLAQPGETVCSRVLWEDDRFGRVTELVELPTLQARVLVEVPAGHSASGQTHWQPLEHLPGAGSQTVDTLVTIITALAGDLYARTESLREVTPFEVEDAVQYQGMV